MKKIAIIVSSIILVVILACSLVACNKSGTEPDSITATFTLDGNDGLDNFSMRRGIVFAHKISRLKKINGVEADWAADGDGKVNMTVKGINGNLPSILAAIGQVPELEFKLENSVAAPAAFKGANNIKSITLSQGSLTSPTIQIELTSAGVSTVSDYLNRQLYIFVGDEYCASAKYETLTNGNTINISSGLEPIAAQTLVAKMNVGAFGIRIKNLSIDYVA